MIDTCIAVTFLFLVIVVIRQFCRGRISNIVIYALWLVLAVRLILPGVEYMGTQVFGMTSMTISSPISIGNAQYALEKAWNQKIQERVQKESESAREQRQVMADRERTSRQTVVDTKKQQPDVVIEHEKLSANVWNVIVQAIFSKRILYGIWLIGFVIILGLQIGTEHRMRIFLVENRERLVYQGEQIYRTKGIATPLLFRSEGMTLDIYVPDVLAMQAVKDAQDGKDHKNSGKIALLEHAVLHEKIHMRHGDIWWGYLRNLLVAVYWFHPIVWLAAILSKRDCEYACDDTVMYRMNETERIAYGNSLLMLVRVDGKDNIFLTATTMKMKTSEMRMRIEMIKKGIHKRTWLLILVGLVVAAAGVAAFTQGMNTNNDTTNTGPVSQTIPQDRQKADEAEQQLREAKERQDGKVQEMIGVQDTGTTQEPSGDAQMKQEEIERLVGKEQQAAAEHSVPDWYMKWESEHEGDDGMLAPEDIHDVQEIFLYKDNTTRSVRDKELLVIFEDAFSNPVEEIKGGSDCPFTQTIYIRMEDGTCGKVLIATDSCSIYSTGEQEYKYYWDVMEAFWKQFGINFWR